jgi:hypothetical protein
MEHQVSLGAVSRTLEALLARSDRTVAMLDRTTGRSYPVSPDLAASKDGLLPVFLVAADAVWRDATDRSFGIEVRRDPQTLLGFAARGISGGPFSGLMLAMMEAIEQVARPGMILVNDFDGLWRAIERGVAEPPDPRRGSAPAPSGG